jgi:glycosyltransferase involved in cell wall biosynthesis
MPEMAAQLRERWSVEPPDIVHAHFWMSGVAATSAAALVGIPVVQTFHALGTVKRRHQGNRDTSPPARIATEARLCRTVERVLATCRDEIAELAALGMHPDSATVVPCGVDTERFTPGPAPTGARPRLLVIGRLVERKGVADVLTALADLPDVDLLVAGGPSSEGLVVDPEAVRLRELARANGTADRLHLLGSVPRPEMPALLRSADVVVAVPWYEPFGIVPLEAMACGRPVVGSAVGGLLDTIVPGVCGDLVPPRRPDLLAAALRDLLADPARREAYSREGVRRVRARYDWNRVCAETETVYGDVLAGYRTSRSTAEVYR